jgi:glycosyltransferase involved in cell wall biosynthesis
MQDNIFKHILFIGPSIKAKGGVASVLQSYIEVMPGCRYLSSTSHVNMLATYLMFALALIKLPFYKLLGITIVHVHGSSNGSWVRKSIIIRWAKLLGYKVIWHCHGGYFSEYSAKRGYDKVRKVLNKCSAVVILTENWLDFFVNKLGLPRVLVVKNIVQRPDSEKVHNNDTLKFLFLGGILDAKGVFDLVEAIHLHKAELANSFKLIIGGNGEVDRLQSQIAEYQLSELIEFVGWVSGDTKKQLLRESDVLILPSYYEGLPISILEGMAYQMPIIATAIGGIPDVVKTNINGRLITPGNHQEIFEAIKYYIDNRDEVTRQGKAAALTINDYYADNVVASLSKLYTSLLS